MITFPTHNVSLLEKVISEMKLMGFDLSNMGRNSYAVNGIPTGIEGLDISNLVGEMVNSALEEDVTVDEEIKKSLALSLAKNAAIPHGQVLNNDEMENIVNQLFACSNVNYTPNRKVILTILRQVDIEKMLN